MVAFQRRGILEPGRVGPTWSSNNISTLVSLSKVGGWVYPRYSNTYCFGNRPSKRRCDGTHRVCATSRHGQNNHDENGGLSSSMVNDAIPDVMPVVSQQEDWRAFRAKLVQSSVGMFGEKEEASSAHESEDTRVLEDAWAHVLGLPERGCLLLANPLMFTTSQTYFNKSVILIFSHEADGSAGVIVNKPTQHVMGEFRDASSLAESYDECRLYLGGDVGPEVLNVLHRVDGIDGANEVIPGVYLGGIDGVGESLGAEESDKEKDVRVLTRYAGWGPGQLEEEVRRGVWIVAAASPDVIFSEFAGDDAWHHVLQLMGGEFAGLSDAAKEEYREDIMEVQSEGDCHPGQGVDVDDHGEDGGHTHGSGI
ncbi:hypothetical protein M9435_003233 [Picochlorum sp. BPE23]|nr:hypothetical protein M9435_003233 [Picochlorum sp. BPE23]